MYKRPWSLDIKQNLLSVLLCCKNLNSGGKDSPLFGWAMLAFWRATFTITETLAFDGPGAPLETVVLPRNMKVLIVQKHVPAISEGSSVLQITRALSRSLQELECLTLKITNSDCSSD